MGKEQFEEQIERKAIVLDVGGFRPPEDLKSSWFGKVSFGAEGEEWPYSNGKPMLPLAQINLKDFPYKPNRLEEIEFITIFMDFENLPCDQPNGHGWELRTYKSLDTLVPLEQPELISFIKPFPMKAREVEKDFPCWEDLPVECPKDIDDEYYDLYQNVDGHKFGGWASLIQGSLSWPSVVEYYKEPEFVFQIDSDDKAKWAWGDGGVGYFGLGLSQDKEEQWVLDWQCY